MLPFGNYPSSGSKPLDGLQQLTTCPLVQICLMETLLINWITKLEGDFCCWGRGVEKHETTTYPSSGSKPLDGLQQLTTCPLVRICLMETLPTTSAIKSEGDFLLQGKGSREALLYPSSGSKPLDGFVTNKLGNQIDPIQLNRLCQFSFIFFKEVDNYLSLREKEERKIKVLYFAVVKCNNNIAWINIYRFNVLKFN